MGTYYSDAWSGTIGSYSFKFRYKVVNSYNQNTGVSTITVTPQFYISYTGTNIFYLCRYGNYNTEGLYINGTTYAFEGASSANKNVTVSNTTSGVWQDMTVNNFTISTFNVTHDSTGKATITLGVWGQVGFWYGSTFSYATIGDSSFATVTVTIQETPLGMVYIDSGSTMEAYQVFIDNGSSWDQYMPYEDNGSNWILCV